MSAVLHSIRVRMMLPLIAITLLLTGAVAVYNLHAAETAELEQARRSAILLANSLDASIQTEADLALDTLQMQIDGLTVADPATQEFNFILLQGASSTIVASNDPGNLELTSPDEHKALLDILQHDQPVVIIDRENTEYTPSTESTSLSNAETTVQESATGEGNMTAPDRIGRSLRSLSLFAPIHLEGEPVGAINVKIVLVELEAELRQMRLAFLGVAALETLGILLIVNLLLSHHVLRPLQILKTTTGAVAEGNLVVRVPVPREDEIGALASDFNVMTAALESRAQEVAELEQLRDDLTNMIVHDMKTPLQVIIGYSGMLEHMSELTSFQANTVARILLSADTLHNMVLNLLDIRRMESGKVELDLTLVNVPEVVQEAINSVRPLAEAEEQTLTVDAPVGLPLVPADREFLRRMLVNLLTNAVRHSEPGSNIILQAVAQDGNIILRVIDQGEGIAPEDQVRIFEKFTQAAKRTRGSKTDTGLGLAFCKLAAEAHGGAIGVESEGIPGRGSVFTVQLPLAHKYYNETLGHSSFRATCPESAEGTEGSRGISTFSSKRFLDSTPLPFGFAQGGQLCSARNDVNSEISL